MGDQDQDLSNLEVADAQEDSMFSIGTASVSSEQEENSQTDNNISVDEIADSKIHHKDVLENKSDIIQNTNVSAGTFKVAGILDSDIILENLPLHQVLLFD